MVRSSVVWHSSLGLQVYLTALVRLGRWDAYFAAGGLLLSVYAACPVAPLLEDHVMTTGIPNARAALRRVEDRLQDGKDLVGPKDDGAGAGAGAGKRETSQTGALIVLFAKAVARPGRLPEQATEFTLKTLRSDLLVLCFVQIIFLCYPGNYVGR